MRTKLTAFVMLSLLGAPLAAGVGTALAYDQGSKPGMSTSQNRGQTIKTEVVQIDGERIITETKNGEQLVFSVEGASQQLKVGDELELMVDDQSGTGVILNVSPQDEHSRP